MQPAREKSGMRPPGLPEASGGVRGGGVEDLLKAVQVIEGDLRAAEAAGGELGRVHPAHRASIDNLAHYLALRAGDIRSLQTGLARLGLSSLGRSEGHILATVQQVRTVLEVLAAREPGRADEPPVGFDDSDVLLAAKTEALFGAAPSGRAARIMVTMPSEAAVDFGLVEDLVRRGMDCARINAAHDGPDAWTTIAGHVRQAAAEAGRVCPVEVDIAGPKLRTGPLPGRPGVVKLRPKGGGTDGRTTPARAWLTAEEAPVLAPGPGPVVPVPRGWLATLEPGARVELHDARGRPCSLKVVERLPGGAWVETDQSVDLTNGVILEAGGKAAGVGRLPDRERALLLRPGDLLVLTRNLIPSGEGSGAARIGCTLPEVFDHLETGHRIWFDDGRIGGTVTSAGSEEAVVEIRWAPPGGAKLRAEKGINLPDTELHLPAIGPDDEAALAFAATHADLVGLSFVQRPSDVTDLQERLAALGGADVGIVLKIETQKAFSRLPSLLVAAMASERVGVMIARGDLAVECGFERLAEVQEEILWLCEAAHLPVIWATQVLDQLAKTGQPSRAEITDAAMAERAECVMLNKGPYISEAVSTLDDILRRMTGHQHKKNPLLRRLRAWSNAAQAPPLP